MIKIEHLSKKYGKKMVLDDINLEIKNGMYGLLGKNGAGKTTLMKILATLINATNGTIEIEEVPIKNKKKVRRLVGYMPQEFSFYPDFTCYEMLDYLLLLEGVSEAEERKEIILETLEQVNLLEEKRVKIKNLSGGMKRRLGIAQAIMTNPKVLIVDEPTVGLDPEERVRFRNLLSNLAKERIVLLSTHIVADIENTCENIGILQKGKLIYNGSMKNLIHTAQGFVWSVIFEEAEWEQIKETAGIDMNKVQSIKSNEGKVTVRFVSKEKLWEHAESAEPTLENAYLCYSSQLMS